MGRRDALIEKYASELRSKCGLSPDLDLLEKVVIGLGPTVYNPKTETVAENDPDDLRRIRDNFLHRKLVVSDREAPMDAIREVLRIYGKAPAGKYRAVVYYLLVRHFGRESAYL